VSIWSRRTVSCVVIESTSDYWKPFYYLLDDALEVTLVNATAVRNLPGRKTDVSDAAWPADLGTHGLVKASFVPPAPVRELRDLTRTRTVGHVSALGLIGRKTPEALAKAVNAIQHYLVTETRLKIPAIFHNGAIASGRDRRARDAPPPRKWPRMRPNNGNSQWIPTFTGGPQHR
jgi:Transposase